MGAVSVAISVLAITGIVGEPGSTATEVRVGRVDTSVDNVGAGTRTSAVVVGIGGGGDTLAGDGTQAPRSRALGHVGVDGEDLLLLDVFDLYYARVSSGVGASGFDG